MSKHERAPNPGTHRVVKLTPRYTPSPQPYTNPRPDVVTIDVREANPGNSAAVAHAMRVSLPRIPFLEEEA